MARGTDPYLDKNGVLINKLGIRDADTLRKTEYAMVNSAQVRMMKSPVRGNFDLPHLQGVHKALFGKVYAWAGKIRTVDISKGDSQFAFQQFIVSSGNKLFTQLGAENHLKGLKEGAFAERAAHYLGEINTLHPFREGNGRTQRVFMSQLAHQAGYSLSWKHVSQEKMIEASVASHMNFDNSKFTDIIRAGLGEKTQYPGWQHDRSVDLDRELEK